jgi:uncharacterized protein (TIGR00369 family)
MTDTAETLTPLAHDAQNRCFGCGPANPSGLHLLFTLAEVGTVVCQVAIPDTFEGPNGCVHGGIIATLMDETMSKAVRAEGVHSMTRHMEVDYLLPVPSSTPIRIEGLYVREEGRKHWAEARILDADKKVLAKSKGLFVEVDKH